MRLTMSKLMEIIKEEIDSIEEVFRPRGGRYSKYSREQRALDAKKAAREPGMTIDADYYAFAMPRVHDNWKVGIRVPDPYGWNKIPEDIKAELEKRAEGNEALADAIEHAKERAGKTTVD